MTPSRRKGARARAAGPLTTADLVVLSLLAERAMHGYDLLREYERQEVADWAFVSRAQVYYALQKLSGLGLIATSRDPATAADRERAVYAPTPPGEDALRAGLAGVAWPRSRVPQPFATWLGLSIHLPAAKVQATLCERRSFLVEEIAREEASLAYIRTLTSPRGRVGEWVVTCVLAQLRAELAWLDDVLPSLGV